MIQKIEESEKIGPKTIIKVNKNEKRALNESLLNADLKSMVN